MQTFIENMPTAELHLHLEDTLEPELSRALARKNNIVLGYETPEQLVAAYHFYDFPSFLTIYYGAMKVVRDEADFYRLTWNCLAKAYSQNITCVELFFDPQAHTSRGVEFGVVMHGIRAAQEDAEAKLGVKSQLVMRFLRAMSTESAMEHLLMAEPYRAWLVGVGLAFDEKNNSPFKFLPVFKKACTMGLKLIRDVTPQNSPVDIDQ